MTNNSTQIKIGSLLSYIQMAITVVVQLFYTPIMMKLLGQNEYGLYNTVASTISMLSLLSLGFNSGYIKFFAIYKKKNDYISISKLNGLFLIVFTIIGIIGLICGLFLSFNLTLVFDQGLTVEEYQKARILMLLLTINLFISFPMSVFQNIVSAHEKFILLKLLSMIKTAFSPLITLPLLLIGYRSIAMVVVTVIVNLFVDIVFLFYVIFRMHEKFIFKNFEPGVFKNLFSYTVFIAINLLIDQINWNIDKLLLGRFRGTSEVAIYSAGFTLYQCYMMFSTSISGLFTPRIHKIVNDTNYSLSDQRTMLTSLFIKVGRIQFLILSLIATGIIFFGKYFLTDIWAGKEYSNAYYVALLLVLPASIALIQNTGIEIQRAENKHQFRSIVYSIMAIINLGLSIFLCQKYGSIGSAIGTALSLVIANGIIMNVYYHKKCNINIIEFWKNILRQSIGLFLPVGFGIIISIYISFNSINWFILWVLLYTIIYIISMWIFGMNKYEKDLIVRPLQKIIKKNNTNL